MAKMVGFACNIKPSWMHYSVQLLEENLTENEYKEKLNTYLSYEIDSPTRLRKTREILMRIWFKEDDDYSNIRKQAVNIIKQYSDYDTTVYLCMIYLFYPVVADVSKFMGKLFEFKDEITNSVLNQKLYDEWGERETLKTVCRRVTLTMKDMGFMINESRLRYKLIKKNITKPEVVNFILTAAMQADGGSYYTFANLNNFYILVPFEYQVSKEQLMNDENFSLNTYDGQLCISLKS